MDSLVEEIVRATVNDEPLERYSDAELHHAVQHAHATGDTLLAYKCAFELGWRTCSRGRPIPTP